MEGRLNLDGGTRFPYNLGTDYKHKQYRKCLDNVNGPTVQEASFGRRTRHIDFMLSFSKIPTTLESLAEGIFQNIGGNLH